MTNILVADDDPVSRELLVCSLSKVGYPIIQCEDGQKALEQLNGIERPTIGILDWMMPKFDGPQVCQALKETGRPIPVYLILLTAKKDLGDIVKGLGAGADDYMTKPCKLQELHARVRVGVRVLSLQEKLENRVQELEQALAEVKQLQGLLPICSYCKMIRNDQNYWQQVEDYLSHRTDIQFSHGVCPHCFEKEITPQLQAMKKNKQSSPITPSSRN